MNRKLIILKMELINNQTEKSDNVTQKDKLFKILPKKKKLKKLRFLIINKIKINQIII